jgi:hypothetical protein
MLRSHTTLTRRELLRSAGRLTFLAGLLAGIGALVAKRGEACTNNGICRSCAAFNGCRLPQALSAREGGMTPK